ncbi:hypothetical protein [Acetoanaerobium noterae]|uniref:hypothetical protein n=1 Tax=Acetoanaerobium noterae TaxID=745369 RepID=UPI0028A628C3|nr:hypothetical protein [Acetoanaerobium noterae]
MENSEALKVLHNLEDLLKQDDRKAIYDLMTHDFKSRVGMDHYLRLEKYRLNLSLPLCLVHIYEASDEKMMLRVKQESKSDHESFANILFVKEEEMWKLSGILT